MTDNQPSSDVQELIDLLHNDSSLANFRDTFPNLQDLNTLAQRAKFITYDLTGHQIIKQGEIADNFFIIMSGQLRSVDVSDPANPKLLNYLTRGAIVGTRGLLDNDKIRPLSVEVVTPAKIARFDEATWNWLMSVNPNCRPLFENLEQTRQAQAEMDFPGRQKDEVVVVATKRHFVAFIATLPLPLTLLIGPLVFFLVAELLQFQWLDILTGALTLFAIVPFIVVALLLIVYNYFDWRNDDLIVTTKRVIHIERILFYGEQRRDAPLARVQDVTTLSDIFDLIFDSDSVRITTAGVGSIEIHHIRKADQVRKAILEQAERAKARVAEADVTDLQHRIAKQLNWDDRLPQHVMSQAEQEWIDPNQQKTTQHYTRIIDYFIPRVKEVDKIGDSIVITWRKHRYILFIHIIIPTLILLAAVYLLFIVGWFFPVNILVGVAFLGSLFWYIWVYDDWHKDLYQVTDTSIIDIEAAAFRLRKSRRDASFDNIQNVYTEVPNLFYKVLNMGHVIIETAGSEETFTFRNVFNPGAVHKEIFNRWSIYQQREREKNRDATTRQVMEVLKEYHRLSQKIQSNP
ncbi:MAG: cyclic nucleotide-binding domain-containing protein [Anaerolineae bacterium]|nr:cyclic nucleotide-binding domain-containing protein [Anaerolineae bacterium]